MQSVMFKAAIYFIYIFYFLTDCDFKRSIQGVETCGSPGVFLLDNMNDSHQHDFGPSRFLVQNPPAW